MLSYPDAYAHIYQKMQSFDVRILAPNDKYYIGYLSLEPSTRSTYDIAMRDATIDALLTSDDIEKIKPGQLFYRENVPNEMFILQSVNQFEFQKNTRNINAIKQNSTATIERLKYNEEEGIDKYESVYEKVASFVTMTNKDEKNFQAGVEDTTNISIQIPKRNIDNELYILNNGDRIILNNLEGDMSRRIKIESIDEYGVPGVIRVYGTYETRTGE
jgi:hypothetical protein